MAKKLRFEILHEQDGLLVVDKPAGTLVIPDRGGADGSSLVEQLRRKRPYIQVVHRIDRDTSGLVVFATDEDTHRSLNEQFAKRKVKKRYLALVEGRPFPDSGSIDQPIAPGPGNKMQVNPKGKASLSHYECLEEFRHFSLVQLRIETGRTHQVRVHMAFIGNPLMVDPLYGSRQHFMLSEVKRNYKLGKWEEERPLLQRLSLHAAELAFKHPQSGEELTFESVLPKDLSAVLKQLRKWDSVEAGD